YALTLRYGLTHGHACGVTLPRLLRYNAAVHDADCVHPGGAAHVRRGLDRLAQGAGARDAAGLARPGGRVLDACELARYDDLGLRPEEHEQLAAAALAYPRCRDNPRHLDLRILTELLAEPCEP